jgi:methyltransferase-like protein
MVAPAAVISALPRAFAPAQWLAANASPWVPTRLHQALGLPVVELGLLALLDGTRDAAALQQALLDGFLSGRYNAQQDGQPVTGAAQLAAVVAQFIAQALPKFQRLGLL